jgi:uncharacterized repeat protein (TIGR01451 family)
LAYRSLKLNPDELGKVSYPVINQNGYRKNILMEAKMKIQFAKLLRLLIALAFSLSPATVSQAAGTWIVLPSGSDSNPCNGPSAPCASIFRANYKASSGDTADVASGNYSGSGDQVVLKEKSVALSSGNLSHSPGDLVGMDPTLDPLSPGILAVNNGNRTGCVDHLGNLPDVDQRGLPRFGRCDIGSTELQSIEYSTKEVNHTIDHPGEAITYAIMLDNPGIAEITNVRMTNDLPNYLEFVDGSSTASKSQTTFKKELISWNGVLGALEQVTGTYTASVDELSSPY